MARRHVLFFFARGPLCALCLWLCGCCWLVAKDHSIQLQHACAHVFCMLPVCVCECVFSDVCMYGAGAATLCAGTVRLVSLMMPSLLCLLFLDAFSDQACFFLCVSMHLEVELLTHEEIPTQCGMATQEWMVTQYYQANDTCMANRPNMRGNPTAHRIQPSLPASQALAP